MDLTICYNCKHFYNADPDSPRADVWYNHFCTASPREETVDVVTGRKAYRVRNDLGMEVTTDDKYHHCREINKGFCPLFSEKEEVWMSLMPSQQPSS